MMRAIAVVLAASSLALGSAAFAQAEDYLRDNTQVGTRFVLEPETADAQTARWLQKRIANCVYNRNEEAVRAVLINSDFYTIDYDAAGLDGEEMFDNLGVSHCMGRVMRGRYRSLYMQFQHSTLRNLLAEEAFLGDFGAVPRVNESAAPDVAARFEGAAVHPQVRGMAAMIDCITHHAGSDAYAMLEARPGSDDEAEAVSALGPTVIACAGVEQSEFSISTSLLRQMVADGLWSRSHYSTSGET